MKMVYIFAYFLTNFAFAVSAEQIPANDIFQLIEQINQSDFGNQKPCDTCALHDETSNDIFQQCAIGLCGSAKKHPLSVLNNWAFDNPANQPEWMNLFKTTAEPIIRSKLEQEKENRKSVIKYLKDQMDSLHGGINSMNTEDLRTLTVRLFEGGIDQWRNSESYDDIVKWDIKVFGNNFIVLPTVQIPEGLPPAFKQMVDSYVEDRKKEIISSSEKLLNITEYRYTPTVLKSIWNQFIEQYEVEKQKKPNFMQGQQEEIKALTKKITKSDRTQTYQLAKQVDTLLAQFRTTKGSPAQYESCQSTQSSICKKMVKEYILKKYQEYEKVDIKKTIEYCKSLFMISPPTHSTIEKLQTMWPDIIQRMQDKILTHYSRQTQNEFMNYINNSLELDFKEDSRKEFLNRINNFSNTEIKHKPLRSYTYQNAPEKNFNPPDFLSVNMLNVFKPSDICQSNLLNQDTLYSSKVRRSDQKRWDKIHVSTFSCAFHNHGKQTLAHELGHVLSHLFSGQNLSNKSYNKYLNLRQCATMRYKIDDEANQKDILSKKAPEFKHEQDKFRTEEDTADIISYYLFPDEPLLRACSFLETEKSGQYYINLDILNKDSKDPYSARFLRLLMSAIYKNKKLPSACQQIIQQYKDSIDFSPCQI